MQLFIAYCNDRHVDTVVKVFDTANAAIIFAKSFASDNCRHEEYMEEYSLSDYLYYAVYSSEGDHVRVQQTILNDM